MTDPPAPGEPAGILDRVEAGIARAATFAGGVAGTVAFFYIVGGVVMWLRFSKLELPADQVVALVPRTDLLVVGLRVMILPALAAGTLFLALALRHRRNIATIQGLEEQEREVRAELESLDDSHHRHDEKRLGEEQAKERRIGLEARLEVLRKDREKASGWRGAPWISAPARTRTWLIVVSLALFLTGLALAVPFTPGALAWPVAAFVLLIVWARLLATPSNRGVPILKGAFPVWRVASAAVLASAGISIARQFDHPVQLPALELWREDKRLGRGVLINATGDSVAVGLLPLYERPRIASYPRRRFTAIVIGRPFDLRAPTPSLLSQLTGQKAWAATPVELWCGGEQYPWSRVASLCRTQPSVVEGEGPLVLDASGVDVPIRCPAQADRACVGFVSLETVRNFENRKVGLYGPLPMGPKPFAIKAGSPAEVSVTPRKGEQSFLYKRSRDCKHRRDTKRVREPRKGRKPLEVKVTISLDWERHAVIFDDHLCMEVADPAARGPARAGRERRRRDGAERSDGGRSGTPAPGSASNGSSNDPGGPTRGGDGRSDGGRGTDRGGRGGREPQGDGETSDGSTTEPGTTTSPGDVVPGSAETGPAEVVPGAAETGPAEVVPGSAPLPPPSPDARFVIPPTSSGG